MKTHASLLIVAAASRIVLAAPAMPDCSGTYPPSRVTQTVEDPQYKDCNGALQGYSSFVVQQRELLRKLRPAYERQLAAEADGSPVQIANTIKSSLDAFDEALGRIVPVNGLLEAGPATSAAPGTNGKGSTQNWLKLIKAERQRLSDRINDAAPALKGDELTTFCRQDFLGRVSTEIEKKVAVCLRD